MNVNTRVLVIGSGQAGCRLSSQYAKKYNFNNLLLFNTSKDNSDLQRVVLLKTGKFAEGSGRNPRITLEQVIPANEELIRNKINQKIESRNIVQIILFNSLGGGSGAAINYYIMNNILIPLKQFRELNIYSVPIFGFKHEGPPITSNQLVMLQMYFSLTGYVTIMPFQNDKCYIKDSKSTYKKTNDFICDSVHKCLDFEYFSGKDKVGGLNTLDRKEYSRMTSPSNGFLIFKIFDNNKNFRDSNEGEFSIRKAKSLIIMFKTKKSESVDIKILEQLHNVFPDQKRIVAESIADKGDGYVEVIANGIPIPENFSKEYKQVLKSVEKNKQAEKKDKIKSKTTLKKIGVSKNRKSLFDI